MSEKVRASPARKTSRVCGEQDASPGRKETRNKYSEPTERANGGCTAVETKAPCLEKCEPPSPRIHFHTSSRLWSSECERERERKCARPRQPPPPPPPPPAPSPTTRRLPEEGRRKEEGTKGGVDKGTNGINPTN
uniref:Uncharacterized protein n=1 Tax=Vespula pensylvanica TaxID=30213 RepID=A0A834JFA2_VESPE|nr:hypothetical protein H0235_018275 [Vespula pensylvanica]